MKKIIIAIDGPAGSGKSTTAKIVAEKLGFLYIDTGAMYRAVTLAWLKSKEDLSDEIVGELLNKITIKLQVSPQGQRTILNDEDVSDDIRLPEVTKFVSPISAISSVRTKLVDMQRELGKQGNVVLDGRDIGTVVFPNAELKIFLVASPEARAQRRALELKLKGHDVSEAEIEKQIIERDRYDSSRENSPLRKANDAIEIDTSHITIQDQCDIIIELANRLLAN
jgi:cytidylate kinase